MCFLRGLRVRRDYFQQIKSQLLTVKCHLSCDSREVHRSFGTIWISKQKLTEGNRIYQFLKFTLQSMAQQSMDLGSSPAYHRFFLSKVLMERSHTNSFTCCLWLLLCHKAEPSNCHRDGKAHKAQNIHCQANYSKSLPTPALERWFLALVACQSHFESFSKMILMHIYTSCSLSLLPPHTPHTHSCKYSYTQLIYSLPYPGGPGVPALESCSTSPMRNK